MNGYISIWGIDDASTSIVPSPDASSSQPATFQAGQLNCDAVNDGACATHNIQVFYNGNALTSYAAGLCRQPLAGNSNAVVCTGGSSCYTDWYLPSVCDLGPFGSDGDGSGAGADYTNRPGSQLCTLGSTNIQQQLVSTNIASISGFYWSSTELSDTPRNNVWQQSFSPSSGSNFQNYTAKTIADGVRWVRGLTN